MSVIKISELNSVETIDVSDVLPIVNEDETKKATIEQVINIVKSNISLLPVQEVASVEEVTQTNILYLVPSSDESNNKFDEYLYVDGKPELLGPQSVDLSSYTTETEVNDMINNAIGGALDGSY